MYIFDSIYGGKCIYIKIVPVWTEMIFYKH